MFRKIVKFGQKAAQPIGLRGGVYNHVVVRNSSSPADEFEDFGTVESYDPTSSYSLRNIKQDGSSRRFYRHVSITNEKKSDGSSCYALRLGNNIAETPEGNQLLLPTKAYALMVALEFQNQTHFIYPHTMPLTNYSLTVLDRLPRERDYMIENCMGILDYDASCYREDPEEAPGLARIQEKTYGPLLKWMKQEFDVELNSTCEFRMVPQPERSKLIVRKLISSMDDYTFAAFEDLTLGAKSVVVGLAAVKSRLTFEQAFKAVFLEENFQIQMFGRVNGIYGTKIPEEFAKLRIATARSALELVKYKLH